MTPMRAGRHRRLLFRAYVFLVAGLLVVAAILDLGFGYLQSALAPQQDPWAGAGLRLIEAELADAPPGDRAAVAARLGRSAGVDIQLLDPDDVALATDPGEAISALVDADGNRRYLYTAPSIDSYIYAGPVEAAGDSMILRLLPPLFYLSIVVVVGLWLRPLLRDLDLITSAAQRFAADYREPLATAKDTTQLTDLAMHLDDMSARLSGLIQTQKELIAALSHEIRTPLARIRFALAVIDRKSDDELHRRLGELNDDVQEIDSLIATMLSYARLDHPDLRMNWQCVPVGDWLNEMKGKLQLPEKELEIDLDDARETLWMDAYLMTLAISNLLANAERYARRRVRLRIAAAGGRQQIEVHDDGEGIPEAQRDSLFKAFARPDDSRNRDTGGSGLGLAIVARIAQLHGGSAGVGDSEDLGGAAFTLSWPSAADEPGIRTRAPAS